MGSRASSSATLPGLPEQVEIAYLAGLIDRGGGFTASRPNAVGLKIVCTRPLRHWLVLRFGGSDTTRVWWLTRQADLLFLLPRVLPYLVVRTDECKAMIALLEHVSARASYNGDAEWRQRREDLMGAVRAARRPQAMSARGA